MQKAKKEIFAVVHQVSVCVTYSLIYSGGSLFPDVIMTNSYYFTSLSLSLSLAVQLCNRVDGYLI